VNKRSDLHHHRFDFSGVESLTAAIGKNTTLTSVHLRNNNLPTRGAGVLVSDMLEVNGSLTELDLSNGSINGQTHKYDVKERHSSAQDGPGFVLELCRGMSRNTGGTSCIAYVCV
jgi:hypothetical protein